MQIRPALGFFVMLSFCTLSFAEGNKAPEAKPRFVEEEVQIIEGATCAREKDERRLEAQTKEAGCVLIYTKHGKPAKIGEAKKGVELCREKLRGVRATLEKGGYTCK